MFEFLGLKSLYILSSVFAFTKTCGPGEVLETFQFDRGIFADHQFTCKKPAVFSAKATAVNVKKPFSMLIPIKILKREQTCLGRQPVLDSCQVSVLSVAEMV